MYFQQATRQTYQTLASQTAHEMDTISFKLPKARLLSKIFLKVEAVATLTSANATIPLKPFSPYGIFRRIKLDLNNGFSPFTLSGEDLFLYSLMCWRPDKLMPQQSTRAINYMENSATAGGKDAKINFTMQLPITLNDRDATGLILLQNEETTVDVTIDVASLADAYKPATGDKVVFKSLKITPVLETYTIPPAEIARPDMSVLKIVQAKREDFSGNGNNTVKLQTGMIYRKLALYFEDKDGNPLKDEDFLSNIDLVFNTADVPISFNASVLAAKNHSELGYPLPDGIFIFDWTYQGIPNLGGTRDYVDTERLTEFELRFNTQKAGFVRIVPETLSRLV
jgi:hypothetical protein